MITVSTRSDANCRRKIKNIQKARITNMRFLQYGLNINNFISDCLLNFSQRGQFEHKNGDFLFSFYLSLIQHRSRYERNTIFRTTQGPARCASL